jgi:hypothetical protein
MTFTHITDTLKQLCVMSEFPQHFQNKSCFSNSGFLGDGPSDGHDVHDAPIWGEIDWQTQGWQTRDYAVNRVGCAIDMPALIQAVRAVGTELHKELHKEFLKVGNENNTPPRPNIPDTYLPNKSRTN